MTQEALKLALEALDNLMYWDNGKPDYDEAREAITAIKEALAQEQEPVAWLSTDSIGERHLCFDKPLDNDPVQPLYTTPPKRTWVGLTDEDVKNLCLSVGTEPIEVRLIEAKLKERNA